MVFNHLLNRYPGLVLVTFIATCAFLPSLIRQTGLWSVQTQGEIIESSFNADIMNSGDEKEPVNNIAMAISTVVKLSDKSENNKIKPVSKANFQKNVNESVNIGVEGTFYPTNNISACDKDMSSPVFSFCPAHITTTTETTCTLIDWDMPVVSDNCNISGLDFDYAPNTCFPVGTTLVTYTATDKTGNQTKCQFKVNIENPDIIAADKKIIRLFDFKKDSKGVLLQWSIQPDSKIEYFIVQRTDDLGEFQGVDIIEGLEKETGQEFFYYDSEPLVGNSTYRIKAILADGNFQYSELKYVSFKKITNPIVFHKKGNNTINIDLSEFSGKNVDIRLINQLGQMLENYNIASATSKPEKLDISGVKPGIYFIHIMPYDDERITKKLVIQ